MSVITMPAMVLVAYATRIPVYRLKLFLGPSVIRLRLSQHRFEVGCIPYGGMIEYWESNDWNSQENDHKFMKLPVLGLIAVSCACVVPQVSVAIVALGWEQTLASGVDGLWQFWVGGLHFWSSGVEMWNSAHEVAAHEGFTGILAHTAAKFGFFMLLPLPFLNFGSVVKRIAIRKDSEFWNLTALITFLVAMLACFGWLIAAIIACVQYYSA